MGLHDRLSRTADGGHALTDVPSEVPADPYAELKAAVHHACIAKLGQELFKEDSTDLNDRVYKAVTASTKRRRWSTRACRTEAV